MSLCNFALNPSFPAWLMKGSPVNKREDSGEVMACNKSRRCRLSSFLVFVSIQLAAQRKPDQLAQQESYTHSVFALQCSPKRHKESWKSYPWIHRSMLKSLTSVTRATEKQPRGREGGMHSNSKKETNKWARSLTCCNWERYICLSVLFPHYVKTHCSGQRDNVSLYIKLKIFCKGVEVKKMRFLHYLKWSASPNSLYPVQWCH